MAVGEEVITDFKPVEERQIITNFKPMETGIISSTKSYQPEPPPFKIDEFVVDWQKTRSMDEDPPQEDMANIFDQVTRPFKTLGYNAISSLNRGIAHFATNLNTIFEYSEEKAGRVTPPEKRGYLFKKIADFYEKDADYWQSQAAKLGPDFLNEFIGKFMGSLGPGMAEFTLSLSSLLTYPAILGAAEAKKQGVGALGETVGAITKATEVGLLGLIFKGLHPFNLYTKAPILGTTFGIEDAAKQLVTKGEVDPNQVIEATTTGFGLGLTPGGRMGLKDVAKNFRGEITRAEAKIEAKKTYERIMGIKREEVKPEIKEEIKPTEIKPKAKVEGVKFEFEVEPKAKTKERIDLFKKSEKKIGLIAWLRAKGGINITDPSADIKAWSTKDSGYVGLISKKGRFIDELAQEWEWETGNKLTTDEFAEMIGDHIMAGPRKGPDIEKMNEPELNRFIEKAQLDWDKFVQAERELEQRGLLSIFAPRKKQPSFEFSDPIIEKSYQESVPVKEPFTAKIGEFFTEIWHKMTRPYEYLPRTKEFAQLQFNLKKLEKQKGVASYDAVIDISKTLSELKGEDYNLFTRKVILDDLKGEAERGHDLPWGLDKDSIKVELDRVNNGIVNNKVIQDALGKRKAMWDAIKDEYTTAMEDIGLDVSERLKNENYFRHQVLEYINLNGLYGTGKKLKTPSSRGFLKAREGSELNINRDFIEPEYEVVSQMLYDIQVAKTIKDIDKNYNIADQVKKDAKAKGLESWHDAVPKGYVTWQPREGNVFYMTDSIPAKLAEKLHSEALKELEITKDDLRNVLAIGKKRKEFVVKEEIANTLDELVKTKTESIIGKADREILKGWKVWQLISPRRFFKYNFRNLTGDADAVFVGNPGGFLKTPQATKELGKVLIGKQEITGELKEFFDRGGFSATLQAQEMGELPKLWTFERLYREQNIPGVTEIPYRVWKKYWKTSRISTDMRETILRYGNYLNYLEQMQKNPDGRPANFGASKPEEIMGLKDIRDRAYWLSNDLLGAYDRISVMGQSLRQYAFPFWSWKELNFKRYAQFAKNAGDDGQLAQIVGRKALGTITHTPFMAYKAGKFLIKATAFWSALQVWNHTMFPEEEDDLSEDEQSQPHIIFGRDSEGNVINFNRIGALGDFLEWFGLDESPKYVDKWFKGEMTLKEIAEDMIQSPVNVIIQGITPQVKVPAELVTGRTLFPDVFKPGTIRDRGFYLSRSLGLENEYKAIAGLPSRGYEESLKTFFVYASDPGQGAYSDIQEAKRRWLKEQGKGAEGFWLTPKGNALYNLKLAIRYEDLEAINKYMYEYYTLGGTAKGIEESLDRMHPLSGLSKRDKSLFEQSLSSEQVKRLEKAMEFYYGTLKGAKP